MSLLFYSLLRSVKKNTNSDMILLTVLLSAKDAFIGKRWYFSLPTAQLSSSSQLFPAYVCVCLFDWAEDVRVNKNARARNELLLTGEE